MKPSARLFVFLLVSIAVIGANSACTTPGDWDGSHSAPLAEMKPAKTAPFKMDASHPFHIELGRGSGWLGLDTVAISQDGKTTLFRHTRPTGWETTTLVLEPASIRRVVRAIEVNKISAMGSSYSANAFDGTQWIIWITQGTNSKSVYFDNHFPHAIRRVARTIDAELKRAGLPHAKWVPVVPPQSRQHERKLWETLK